MAIINNIKSKFVAVVVVVSVIIIPGYSLVANINPGQWATTISHYAEQIRQYAEMYQNAQQQLQQLKDLAKLDEAIKNRLRNAATGEANRILGREVGANLSRSGTNINQIDGKVGKIDIQRTNQQFELLKTPKNDVDAVTMQTEIMLKNQQSDRLNVSSMLDEKPTNARCTRVPDNQCTILKLLKENEADAVQELQTRMIGLLREQQENKSGYSSSIVGKIRKSTGDDPDKVAKLLTPQPALPLALELNPNTTQDLNSAAFFANILMGGKHTQMYDPVGKSDEHVLATASRMGKLQLARTAISSISSKSKYDLLSKQFRQCVGRPDMQDAVGSSPEQHSVNVQSLLRCNNMILLQTQQQDMENQRLLGAILLSLIDLYAVQEQPTKEE